MESNPTLSSVFVQDLRLSGRIGVYAREHDALQPVLIDVYVEVKDLDAAARSERLKDTLNYEKIAHIAKQVVQKRHYPLVETLATSIAEAVLKLPRANKVRVCLRKMDCIPQASAAGVEVTLHKEHLHPKPIQLDQTKSVENVVIVGTGVAGLSASLWCQRLGIRALLVDPCEKIGGQLHLVHRSMTDLPGMEPVTGHVLAQRLWTQFAKYEGRWLCNRVSKIDTTETGCLLYLEKDGDKSAEILQTKTAIIATGLQRRRLKIAGEQTFLGKGILATASLKIDNLSEDQILIIGGGDAACENALLLAQTDKKIILVHRGPFLSARNQFKLLVETTKSIDVRLNTQVNEFGGENHLEEVVLADPNKTYKIPIRLALIRIGWEPNSQFLNPIWLDDRGFLRITSSASVVGEKYLFGAGDIVTNSCWSVAYAMGSGSKAAKSAIKMLEQ